MRSAPWHSATSDVHHNNRKCTTGNNIETLNLRQGTGGKRLCKDCADLNRKKK